MADSGISESFYKIGAVQKPRSSENTLKLDTFNTFSSAADNLIQRLSGSESNARFIKASKDFNSTRLLESEKFKPFLANLGYNPSAEIRRLSKNHFAVTSKIDTSAIMEVFQTFDFEEHMDEINAREWFSVDGIVASSATGESVILAGPTSLDCGIRFYSQKSKERPRLFSNSVATTLHSHPIGAASNPASNQYAAIEFMHELSHVGQDAPNEYLGELDASEKALNTTAALAAKGIAIMPQQVSLADARHYLEEQLLGYARRYAPFKALAISLLGKVNAAKK